MVEPGETNPIDPVVDWAGLQRSIGHVLFELGRFKRNGIDRLGIFASHCSAELPLSFRGFRSLRLVFFELTFTSPSNTHTSVEFLSGNGTTQTLCG